jgi:hypothetical protein
MAELRVASYASGLRVPARLELSGGVPGALVRGEPPRSFTVDWLDSVGNVALHLSARPDADTVVLNSFLDGGWGEEVVVAQFPFALAPDVPFRLVFEVLDRSFRIAVDGRRLVDFEHRVPPSSIREVRASIFLWRLDSALGKGLRKVRGTAVPPTVVPSILNGGPSRGWRLDWARAETNPAEPEPLGQVRLFAALCTWMEGDVIEATVANCLRQGCERVYLVDNGSPDDTVERAVAAGAQLAGTFDGGHFVDMEKTEQLQTIVETVSQQEHDEHIWWLLLDADEFYHGPGGLTLRDYLARLDRRFRVVGARFFNHLPTERPAYVRGRHPLDFQPLCYEIAAPYCEHGHWRHALQRFDRSGPLIKSGKSFHEVVSAEPLVEPTVPVFFHHFPYRAESDSRRRLERLFAEADGAGPRVVDERAQVHMRLRRRSVEAVYRQQWDAVVFYPTCAPGFVPTLKRWEDWVDATDARSARWY